MATEDQFTALEEALKDEKDLSFRREHSASALTTVALGGPISLVVQVNREDALVRLMNCALGEGITIRPLGFGSNSLFPDEGYKGVLIKFGGSFKSFNHLSEKSIEVGAGYGLMRLSRETSKLGLSGLEFAGGIPGSLGGGVRMNAGAHGSDLSTVISSIRCITPEGKIEEFSQSELSFRYRACALPKDSIVLSAKLTLTPGDSSDIERHQRECLDYRKATQPLTLPSFGSVFRNPELDGETRAAGELLEEIGAKGRSEGGAQFSPMHANWIVNEERNASYKDVKSLMLWGESEVLEKHGVRLVPEVVDWAEVSE